ncbi:S1 family peptidase [Flindersiella endophytica]
MKRMTGAAAAAVVVLVGMAAPALAMSGGKPVTELPDQDQAPWVATLAYDVDAPLLQRAGCGAVLIAPDRVLTAGHCVDRIDPSGIDVHLNARVLSKDEGEKRGVSGISVLSGYKILPSPVSPDDPNQASARNDLAVIFLDKPVTDIQPVPIAAQRPRPKEVVSMYSHGTTGSAAPGKPFRDDILARGDLSALGNEACHRSTPAEVDTATVMCAQDLLGPRTITGCYLDSGSPAVVGAGKPDKYGNPGGAGQPELVGVFSFGGETANKKCGEASPAYFADAATFRKWAYAPFLLRQPYPSKAAEITGDVEAGRTVRCASPKWSLRNGLPPVSVKTHWVTVTYQGPWPSYEPIPGATKRKLDLDPGLDGKEIACQVVASNPGGTTQVTSPSRWVGQP